jgi:putative RecB family exonuclease
MCEWCSHRAICPAFDGTPPPYPGWPEPDQPASADQTLLDRAE